MLRLSMGARQTQFRQRLNKMASRNILYGNPKYPALLIEYGAIEDLHDVMKVMATSFSSTYGESWNYNQCRSMLSLPGSRLLLSKNGNLLLGFAISRAIASEEEILMIAVDPEYQKDGIGFMLLTHLLDRAREDGVASVFLEVRSNNPAQVLYHKLGFQETGIRKAYYTGRNSEKFDAVTYKLSLNSAD